MWELLITLPLVMLLPKFKAHLFARKGQIFGVWLTVHGLGRLLMESFRDDFRGPEPLGFSISTGLSVLAILFGGLLFTRRFPGQTKVDKV